MGTLFRRVTLDAQDGQVAALHAEQLELACERGLG